MTKCPGLGGSKKIYFEFNMFHMIEQCRSFPKESPRTYIQETYQRYCGSNEYGKKEKAPNIT